jgi:site-specific recombinase XerD
VRQFQLYLIESGTSICNRNRIMTAVRFLFRVTLRRHDLAAEVWHIKEPQKLPPVLSPEEVKRVLTMATSLKARTMLTLAYGCGLRASEVVRLRAGDIDSAQTIIRIVQSKAGPSLTSSHTADSRSDSIAARSKPAWHSRRRDRHRSIRKVQVHSNRHNSKARSQQLRQRLERQQQVRTQSPIPSLRANHHHANRRPNGPQPALRLRSTVRRPRRRLKQAYALLFLLFQIES